MKLPVRVGSWSRKPIHRQPSQRKQAPGNIFPVYNVFEAIAGIRNVLPVSISNHALVTAFAFQDEQGQSIALIANPTAEPKPVTLHVVDSELDILKRR